MQSGHASKPAGQNTKVILCIDITEPPSSFRRSRECCMAERFDRIWHNARLATLREDLPELGAIEHGVIAARDGRIVFAGPHCDFPSSADAAERIDCAGRWITPGLVDCHTHLVFGGNRAHEFELQLQGASYEAIARAGGGIVSTVAATRAASEVELVTSALPRLDVLIGEGVTTLEIKSGYGLNTATEMRQLSAARVLGRTRPVAIRTTFLGAHALPPEADGARRDGRRASAGRVLFHSRDEEAAGRIVACPQREHGARDRLQPRQLAADVPSAGHEYGRDAVPHDRC